MRPNTAKVLNNVYNIKDKDVTTTALM